MNIKDLNDIQQWATQQWGQAELGDARRNQRAIQIGAEIAAKPEASLPEQMANWGDLKAAYRLLGQFDVTHTGLSQPHWQNTRGQASVTDAAVVLFGQDSSELDYTHHNKTKNLGHIGNGKGKGLLLHSCLGVIPRPEHPQVLGVAHQKVWRRFGVIPKSETRSGRANRRTESDVWAEIVEEIGCAPVDDTAPAWVSVGDRASDVFSYIRRSKQKNWHCLLRVSQERVIQTADGVKGRLFSLARSMSAVANKTIVLRGRNGLPKRTVNLLVAWSPIKIFPPANGPERKLEPISGWCIRAWEATDRPDGLEWIVFTTVPITAQTSVLTQVDWYALRWLIEEYHKCLKTGCAVESAAIDHCRRIRALTRISGDCRHPTVAVTQC